MRWLHFVGGHYTPKKFLAEAKSQGISRRCPTTVAKAMSKGDEVLLLDWTGREAKHFATFSVDTLFLDSAHSKAAADKLGLAPASSSGRMVVRECGSFVLGLRFSTGGHTLRALIEAAEAAGPLKSVMIGGSLTEELDPQKTIPGIGFFRGFARETPSQAAPVAAKANAKTVLGLSPASTPGILWGIEGYKPRSSSERLNLVLDLPIELPPHHPLLSGSDGRCR